MKKVVILLFVFLLTNLVYAQQDKLYNSEYLKINVDVSSDAIIKPTSSDYSIKYITVNLSHYPYEALNQQVIGFDVFPQATIENNAVFYKWENPENKISFGYNAKIKTNSNIIKVSQKIPFPIKNLPEEVRQYTMPSEIIDSDNEGIVKLSSKLAEGEDDLNVIVHKIAAWTKDNIKYDLSTLTAEVSQKASWVLENKQGVRFRAVIFLV